MKMTPYFPVIIFVYGIGTFGQNKKKDEKQKEYMSRHHWAMKSELVYIIAY